jgi:hypothetical protein
MIRTNLCTIALGLASLVQGQSSVDAAFARFWAADNPADAQQLTGEILKTGVSFDEAWQRLRRGRTYSAVEPGVVISKNRTGDTIQHFYAVNIPAGYDPSKRYQVRFQLHGGVGGRNDNQPRGNGEIGSLAGAEQIYVLPYAWDAKPWWSEDQVLNLADITDKLKRKLNVDENRVVVSGVSDGGTGAYYVSMKDTTPYASFLPLNGYIMVLSNPDINDGTLFPNNLRNKPVFAVNGGKDRLYPTSVVEPYTHHLMAGGVEISYHPQPEGEHNTRWWPEVKDIYEGFVKDHPREPHPVKLTWQTANAAHGRAHWLVIDKLGTASGEAKDLADVNQNGPDQGPLLESRKPSGRADVSRQENTITALTRGVKEFMLLLSPDVFDFSRPIQVVANGKEVFQGRVEKDLKTLLKWAAKDNDRTMLYGAELKIVLK